MTIGRFTIRFRTLFWAATALAVAVILVIAFRPRPVLVDLAEVDRGDVTAVVRDEARTRIRDFYVVSSPVAGRLLRVGDRVGERVEAGQAIATIQPGPSPLMDDRSRRELQAAVRSAEAALGLARAEVDRAEAVLAHANVEAERTGILFEANVASRSAVDRAALEVRTASAALRNARAGVRAREADLDAARIRLREPDLASLDRAVTVEAPITGRILRVLQESERVVAQGAPLIELGNSGELEVVAELLSSDAARIRVGAPVVIDAWGGSPVQGRVRRIEPYGFLKVSALGVEEQRVNVIIDPVERPAGWAAVGHGYRVEVSVAVRRAPAVVRLPVGALFRHRGRWAVFRIDRGRARLRLVEIGDDDGEFAEVRSGVRAGDSVVLYPGESVSDGVRVRARPSA